MTRRTVQRACWVVFVACSLNFWAWVVGLAVLGGQAVGGGEQSGAWFVAHKGHLTEVSRAAYVYSSVHTASLFLTHPLAFLSAGIAIWSQRRYARRRRTDGESEPATWPPLREPWKSIAALLGLVLMATAGAAVVALVAIRLSEPGATAILIGIGAIVALAAGAFDRDGMGAGPTTATCTSCARTGPWDGAAPPLPIARRACLACGRVTWHDVEVQLCGSTMGFLLAGWGCAVATAGALVHRAGTARDDARIAGEGRTIVELGALVLLGSVAAFVVQRWWFASDDA